MGRLWSLPVKFLPAPVASEQTKQVAALFLDEEDLCYMSHSFFFPQAKVVEKEG